MASHQVGPYRPSQTIITPLPADKDAWRLEIDELLTDPDLTNIFLLALKRLQDEPVLKAEADDWLSYYNLAGIHGDPREKWNNIDPVNLDPKGNPDAAGQIPYWYCEHGTDVFPTFHRAYIMMYEQALHARAQKVAAEYTNPVWKAKYQNAARRLRLPYWDPYLPRYSRQEVQSSADIWGLPEILKAERVFVRLAPDGNVHDIPNPLFQFNFPEAAQLRAIGRVPVSMAQAFDDGDIPLAEKMIRDAARTPHTLRAPGPDGKANLSGLERAIRRQAKTESSRVWQMLRSDDVGDNENRTWERFSNHNYDPDRLDPKSLRMAVSLEGWHDSVHGLVGSANWFVPLRVEGGKVKARSGSESAYSGHMAEVSVASFDPIFWLHHNNIDRYFAIFQALWPNKYVTTQKAPYPHKDVETWLRPFYVHEAGKMVECTSRHMESWEQVRFAVPGVTKLDKQGVDVLQTYLKNSNYWATETPNKPPPTWPKNVRDAFVFTGVDPQTPRPRQWTALVHTPQGFRLEEFSLEDHEQLVTRPAAFAAGVINDVSDRQALPKGCFVDEDTKTQQWVWNAYFTVRKYAFNGSFNIHFFLGHVGDTDPLSFFVSDNEAGYSTVFAADEDAACARCREGREKGMLYEDAVPLTPVLLSYLRASPDAPTDESHLLEDLDPARVAPFLEKHLKWRITDTKGNVMPSEALAQARLEVSVWARVFDRPTAENKLGYYGPAEVYAQATRGKPAGFSG